jgi:hypothetical protein
MQARLTGPVVETIKEAIDGFILELRVETGERLFRQPVEVLIRQTWQGGKGPELEVIAITRDLAPEDRKGNHLGGNIPSQRVQRRAYDALRRYDQGERIADIAKDYKVSPHTLRMSMTRYLGRSLTGQARGFNRRAGPTVGEEA